MTEFPFFPISRVLLACSLLAACLLAKPVRSTLDTKKGYKSKTGSTSSVTLTLTLTLTLPPRPYPWLDAPLTPGQTPPDPRQEHPPPTPGRTPPPPRPPAGPPPPPPTAPWRSWRPTWL